MATEAELIIRTLDRHLAGPADIRLFGGAALVLAYGLTQARIRLARVLPRP